MRSKAAQQLYLVYRIMTGFIIAAVCYLLLNLIPFVHLYLKWAITWIFIVLGMCSVVAICILGARFLVFYRKGL